MLHTGTTCISTLISDTCACLLSTPFHNGLLQNAVSCPQPVLLSSCHGHGHGLTLVTRSSAIAEGPCDASCQLKSCQLPRNSAETTYATSPDQIDGMMLEI